MSKKGTEVELPEFVEITCEGPLKGHECEVLGILDNGHLKVKVLEDVVKITGEGEDAVTEVIIPAGDITAVGDGNYEAVE